MSELADGVYALPRGYYAVVTTPSAETVVHPETDPKARCLLTGFRLRSCQCFECRGDLSRYNPQPKTRGK